jgi:tetratricopeptide (TPR) repeat protein
MSQGWAKYFQRDYDWAAREYRKATDFDPEFHVAHWMASWALVEAGRLEEAVASITRAIDVSKGLLICYPSLARALASAGRGDEARRVLADLEANAPGRYVMPLEVGLAYEALAERDTALAWFELALKERSHWWVAAGVDPRFDSLRDDARFQALMEKVRPAES